MSTCVPDETKEDVSTYGWILLKWILLLYGLRLWVEISLFRIGKDIQIYRFNIR
jgi:hypothetical protein